MLMELHQIDHFESDEQRWAAVQAKDPRADGIFFFAVSTTGVFCRPTCASRLPRRENVTFFASAAQAASAGFRPCKRCRPDQPAAHSEQQARILHACALIEQAEVCPTLAELSAAAGFSPFHFQRLFRQVVGVTPRQYFDQKRAERVRAGLQSSASVTDALYSAGYGSSAQFYSQAAGTLGMTPGQYRAGGQGVEIRHAVRPCSLGWVLVAATPAGVCAIEFGDHPEDLERALLDRFPAARDLGQDAAFGAWVDEALAFIEQPARGLNLPLDIQGTSFQRKVWQALREIPSGQRASYTEVARRIGQPGAARAVASACAANRLAVAIPCHRVVRENGELSGYRWGIERKRTLLEREAKTP